ncbi:MAG TPA: helix-turn-helix domain-containing protein [Myxococcota bacterium]|nr:helix-turn-helix domain-containing protein [Myxococcota bacterium]HOA13154.1 helix-turn-helix domain-containing protein [Myxococcota bacterium]HOH76319.1 helix-turn-helix domain-containing protein [Myxococcota bacterium]HPV02938.1 helix-turn-helix domain-containing protein [Myxococcota bacterium]
MNGIGSMLRQGREAAGLGQDELARMIRLSPAAVRALEDERFTELPGKVFVRGFVISWARAVGIDERHALDALERSGLDAGVREVDLPRPPEPTWITIGTGRRRPSGRRLPVGAAVFGAMVVVAAVILGIVLLSGRG